MLRLTEGGEHFSLKGGANHHQREPGKLKPAALGSKAPSHPLAEDRGKGNTGNPLQGSTHAAHLGFSGSQLQKSAQKPPGLVLLRQ